MRMINTIVFFCVLLLLSNEYRMEFFFRCRYINETGNETKKNFYDTTSDDSRSNHQERLWKEYNHERVSGEKKERLEKHAQILCLFQKKRKEMK